MIYLIVLQMKKTDRVMHKKNRLTCKKIAAENEFAYMKK